MSKVGVGDAAPTFSALGTGDRKYELSEFRGRPVVLVFYPGDETAVCTQQLKSYNNGLDAFKDFDAQVLAMSPQDVASHEKFSKAHAFGFPLLYDKDKKVATAYGVLGPLGFYRRSIFVIGSDGRIAYAKRGLTGLTYVKTPELLGALRSV